MFDFDDIPMRTLPEAVYDLACHLYPTDGNRAIRRLVDALSEHELKMLSTIALRDGIAAAERYYLSRPRRLRISIARPNPLSRALG